MSKCGEPFKQRRIVGWTEKCHMMVATITAFLSDYNRLQTEYAPGPAMNRSHMLVNKMSTAVHGESSEISVLQKMSVNLCTKQNQRRGNLFLPEERPRFMASWSLSPCSLSPWPLSLELTRSASWNAELEPDRGLIHFVVFPINIMYLNSTGTIYLIPSHHAECHCSNQSYQRWKSGDKRFIKAACEQQKKGYKQDVFLHIYLFTRLGLSTM